ncbi:hypothetical protein LOD99_14871 [Oopsacas minuta]|uniref:Immunoglobulin domain-containing protein n=1 Tax=Oopsacas minuta TaxID=111878 RepID=A0AAV7KCH2_9METZ|nr:hypothetical protein LOD99_14871 [Oopsacas minuta]
MNPIPNYLIILSEPQSQNASYGDNVVFKVEATGLRLTYQWYRQNGLNIQGASKPFLSLGPLKKEDFGFYRVRIQDYYGDHLLSSWIELVDISSLEHAPPVFVIEPKPACGRVGDFENIFVHATGVNIRYQWYNERGMPLSGETRQYLLFAPIKKDSFGYYRCLASDKFGRQILSCWLHLAHQ